jgi:hypothetical protein
MEVKRKKKVAILLAELFLCNDEQHSRIVNPYLPLLFSISSWPHCLDPPVLHTNCLIPRSVNHIFEYANDSSFEKLTCLNREVFEMIYSLFFPFWHLSINGGSHSKLHSHHLLSKECLGILLHWMAHGIARTPLAVIAGISVSSVSRYMRWRIFVLHDILQNIPATTTTCPPAMYLQQIRDIVGNLYGEVM